MTSSTRPSAVTIEFLGPLLLAAVLSRSLADALCVLLALSGIALLGLDSLTGSALEPVFAAFFGWLLLAQPVTVLKGAAVCLVVAASILQPLTTSRRRPKKPAPLEPVRC